MPSLSLVSSRTNPVRSDPAPQQAVAKGVYQQPSPLDKIDEINQGRDIHGNKKTTANLLAGGGVKLEEIQRAKQSDTSKQFRMVNGKIRFFNKQEEEDESPESGMSETSNRISAKVAGGSMDHKNKPQMNSK